MNKTNALLAYLSCKKLIIFLFIFDLNYRSVLLLLFILII